MKTIREAANDLCDRWETQLWKDVEHTAVFIHELRMALAQPEQEPVAWRTCDGEDGYDYRSYENNEQYANEFKQRNPHLKDWVEPLYTTPPKRTWVGLTDEWVTSAGAVGRRDLLVARAIEAKLKELNEAT